MAATINFLKIYFLHFFYKKKLQYLLESFSGAQNSIMVSYVLYAWHVIQNPIWRPMNCLKPSFRTK